jgi:N-acetylglucosamine kinase-like BadF-type ATPase
MKTVLLAIDVGGSTSRACLIDEAGNCLGQGRSRGGNPASNNPDEAASAIISAVEAAVAEAGENLAILVALIALAGPRGRVAEARLAAAFRASGLTGPIVFSGDLLAMFTSITASADGYCVVSGTGAGAVRIRAGEIEHVVDAAGWLLGDNGSGYWLGHQAARAAVAEIEHRGEPTTLTPALFAALGVEWTDGMYHGRLKPLQAFIDAIYTLRPIELARFAPIVIAHRADPVAARLLAEAERYLAAYFALAFDPTMPGPVALGGGVIAHLAGLPDAIAATIRAAGHKPIIRLATDGSIGAAVLAMRAVGIAVDDATIETIRLSLAARAGR